MTKVLGGFFGLAFFAALALLAAMLLAPILSTLPAPHFAAGSSAAQQVPAVQVVDEALIAQVGNIGPIRNLDKGVRPTTDPFKIVSGNFVLASFCKESQRQWVLFQGVEALKKILRPGDCTTPPTREEWREALKALDNPFGGSLEWKAKAFLESLFSWW